MGKTYKDRRKHDKKKGIYDEDESFKKQSSKYGKPGRNKKKKDTKYNKDEEEAIDTRNN